MNRRRLPLSCASVLLLLGLLAGCRQESKETTTGWATALGDGATSAAVFLGDSGRVAAISGRSVYILSAADGSILDRLKVEGLAEERQLTDLDYRAAGDLLAVAASDGSLRVWQLAKKKLLLEQTDLSSGGFPTRAALHPSQPLVARHVIDGEVVRICNLETGAEVQALQAPGGIYAFAWSGDGSRLAVSWAEGAETAIWVYNTTDWSVSTKLSACRDAYNGLCFDPQQQRLFSACSDDTVQVWSLAEQKLLQSMEGGQLDVWTVDYDAAGKRLASGAVDGITIWDVATGRQIKRWGFSCSVFGVRFSADGKQLLTCGSDGRVRMWHVD